MALQATVLETPRVTLQVTNKGLENFYMASRSLRSLEKSLCKTKIVQNLLLYGPLLKKFFWSKILLFRGGTILDFLVKFSIGTFSRGGHTIF